MKIEKKYLFILGVLSVLPVFGWTQTGGLGDDIQGLQGVLNQIHDTMIQKCTELIGVGKGIAAFAAIWYIGSRVWGHISRAEPVDIFPLFRPFVIGFAIFNFTTVVALIEGVMQPAVTQTAALVTDSNKAIAALLQQKQDALQNSTDWQMYVGPSGSGSEEIWEQKSGDASTGTFSGISNWAKFEMAKASYNLKNSIKVWMSEILRVLFEAAALCINTVRTFYMVILAILGPLVFGLSVFDGMQHLLRSWVTRYINIFLWLPVANLFGSIIGQIQEEMIKLDIKQLQATGQTSFGPTDAGYIIFLVMGIVGYFTVPSVANYIINAGGGNTLMSKITSTSMMAASTVIPGGGGGGSLGSLSGGGSHGSSSGKGSGGPGMFGISESTNTVTGETAKRGFLAEKLKGKND